MKLTFRQRLARWLAPEARSTAFDAGGGFPAGFATPTTAGPSIDERTALSISAVWSAVNCYVNTIGSLDLYVAERDARGGRRPAVDHWAFDLVRSRPNRVSTSMRFRQAWVGHALTHGNGYAEIQWDARGRQAVALHLMDPRRVEPRLLDDGSVTYRLPRQGEDLPPEDVLHLAMFGWDGLKGYSPISVARETLGVAAAQREYQGGLYGNSAAAQGHLEVPGKLTSKTKGELRDDWNRMHQGPQNAGNIGILDGGMKWVQTNFSPVNAQMILGSNWSVAEVARIFNIPQHKIGLMEGSTFSNIEEQNIDFYQTSILPWLTAIEQEMDSKLLGRIERKSYFVFHDVNTLLRANTTAQVAQDQADLGSGVRSVNEVRIARGLDPIDDPNADKHWIPVNNLTALEDMPDSGPEPPPPPAPDPGPGPDDAPPPGATLASLRDVLADPVGRMIRQECQAARRAARAGRLLPWIDEFYPRHVPKFAEAIAPGLRVLAAHLGGTITPAITAEEWTHGTSEELRRLASITAPEELPAAVDLACSGWEATLADSMLDHLLGKPGGDLR